MTTLGTAGLVQAQSCPPQWLPGNGLPGINGTVNALVNWDPDGAGPEPVVLVAGGTFSIAGDALASNIAAWDGTRRKNTITDWIVWFAAIGLEAQRRTLAEVEFIVDKAHLLGRFRERLSPREMGALVRVLREGPEGFKGGLSAGNYAAITKTAASTATRDLSEMVEMGVLTRTGNRKGTRYRPLIPLRPVRPVTIGPRGEIIES